MNWSAGIWLLSYMSFYSCPERLMKWCLRQSNIWIIQILTESSCSFSTFWKRTDLAVEYQKYLSDPAYTGPAFHIPDADEYIGLLTECIQHLRPEIVIHRLTGDGPEGSLDCTSVDRRKTNCFKSDPQIYERSWLVPGKGVLWLKHLHYINWSCCTCWIESIFRLQLPKYQNLFWIKGIQLISVFSLRLQN